MVPFVAKKVWIISNKSPEDWWKKGLEEPMQRRLKDPIGHCERMDYGVWEPPVVPPASAHATGWFVNPMQPRACGAVHPSELCLTQGLVTRCILCAGEHAHLVHCRGAFESPYHRDGCAATGCTYEQSADGFNHVSIPGQPNDESSH